MPAVDLRWGADMEEDSVSKYVIAHSLERNGLCVFKDEGLSAIYLGGPYATRQEAEAFLSKTEARDASNTRI